MSNYQFDVEDARNAPFDQSYVLDVIDFGGGDSEAVIVAPAGRYGVVRSVEITRVTEIFSSVTSDARVDIGVAGGDEDAYVSSADFGALAPAATLYPALTAGVSRNRIPRDASVGINCIAPVGSPTGIADVIVTISWFK